MNSLSPRATRAAARAGSSQPSSLFCSPRTARATTRVMSAVATSNNESTNKSTTPASSTEGNSSISTLTVGTAARRINRGEAENNGDDVDFVEAGRGGGFDDDLVVEEEESGREERNDPVEEELPPLHSIFDCAYIVVRVGNDGKEVWECRWCSKIFAPKHASRALRHVLKIRKNDIAVCKSAIPEIYHKRYSDLYNSLMGRQAAKKRSSESAEESVAILQNEAVGNLLRKRGQVGVVSVHHSSSVTPASSANHLSFAGGVSASSMSSYTSTKGQSFQRTMSTMNMDIRKSNNATVEMSIADFFHCENIPDSVAESPRFLRLIRVCRLVGEDFVVPSRRRIGGELLDLNFKNTYERNKAELLKEVKVFGLAFMGDGATIHRMPLLNILAMSGVTPPITVSIQDCSKHMAEGGKKDASYIADLFEEKVVEYDPQRIYTDVFYFDGASNVQKAGDVLMARFPRSFCFHGGEHVVSLFFSSIAKIKPIKVRYAADTV